MIQYYMDGLILCLNTFNNKFIKYKSNYTHRLLYYFIIQIIFFTIYNLSEKEINILKILLSTPFIQNILWTKYNRTINSYVNIINTNIKMFIQYYISVKIIKYLRNKYSVNLDNTNIFKLFHVVTINNVTKCIHKLCLYFVMYILNKYNSTYFNSIRYIIFIETNFWLDANLTEDKANFVIYTLITKQKWENIVDYQFMQSIFVLLLNKFYKIIYVIHIYIYFVYCSVNLLSIYIEYLGLFYIILYEYLVDILISYPYDILRVKSFINKQIHCICLYFMLNYTNNILFITLFYSLFTIIQDLLCEIIFFIKNYYNIIKTINFFYIE